MAYFIAGANLANTETPNISHRVDTAIKAVDKVAELERDGYRVRVATSEGDEVSIDDLKALVAAGQDA